MLMENAMVIGKSIEGTLASANRKLRTEVSEMPGMSQVIYEKGWKAGEENGKSIGHVEGFSEG